MNFTSLESIGSGHDIFEREPKTNEGPQGGVVPEESLWSDVAEEDARIAALAVRETWRRGHSPVAASSDQTSGETAPAEGAPAEQTAQPESTPDEQAASAEGDNEPDYTTVREGGDAGYL